MPSNALIRQQKRQQRRNLNARSAMQLSQLANLNAIPSIGLATKRVALYLATGNELATNNLILYCWARGIRVYLPTTLNYKTKMQFVEFTPTTKLIRGKFGIRKPVNGARLSPRFLQRIYAPLVAFDSCCNRIGMGAGYYDRKMAFLKYSRRTKYIGLAYSFQESAEPIQASVWDVSLDMVITEEKVFRKSV